MIQPKLAAFFFALLALTSVNAQDTAGNKWESVIQAFEKQDLAAKPGMTRWHLKETYETYNRLLKGYVKKARRTRYVDIWTPLLDEAGNLNPAVYAEDKLHLNAEGYRTIQPAIASFLK